MFFGVVQTLEVVCPFLGGNIDYDLFVNWFLLRSNEVPYSSLFSVQVVLYVSGELFPIVFFEDTPKLKLNYWNFERYLLQDLLSDEK